MRAVLNVLVTDMVVAGGLLVLFALLRWAAKRRWRRSLVALASALVGSMLLAYAWIYGWSDGPEPVVPFPSQDRPAHVTFRLLRPGRFELQVTESVSTDFQHRCKHPPIATGGLRVAVTGPRGYRDVESFPTFGTSGCDASRNVYGSPILNFPYRGEYEIEFSRSSAAYALLERHAPMSLERFEDTATGAVAVTLAIVLGGAACVGSLLAALWAIRA